MARIYHGQSTSINGDTYTAELWNGSTAASPDASVEVAITPIQISYNGEGGKLYEDNLRESSCEVGFSAYKVATSSYDSTIQTALQAIATAEEQKWALLIWKGSALHWVGRVDASQMQYERSSVYGDIIRIKAVDGLGLLKGYKVDSSWFSSNQITVSRLISRCINITGLLDYWTTAGAQNAVIKDTSQDSSSGQSSTYKIGYKELYIDAFIISYDPHNDVSLVEFMDCKTALEMAMREACFNSRLMLSEGAYWVKQLNAFNGSSVTYDTYDYNGNSAANNTVLQLRTTLASAARPCWEAKPVQSFQPPLRGVEMHLTKMQAAVGTKTTKNTTVITATHDAITAGSVVSGSVLNGEIQFTFAALFDTDSARDTGAYNLAILYYGYNSGTGNYYTWNPLTKVWSIYGASAPTTYTTNSFDLQPNGKATGSKEIKINTTSPPSGVTAMYAKMYVESKTKTLRYNGAGSWISGKWVWGTNVVTTINFSGLVKIQQAYNSTEEFQYENDVKVSSTLTSPRNTNAELAILDFHLYNGITYDRGNVKVYSGSAWVNPGVWGATWDSATGDIPQICANAILSMYQDFVPTIRGNLVDAGDYLSHLVLYFDSKNWILNGGTWDSQSDQWNGEWIQINPSFTYITANGEEQRYDPKDTTALGQRIVRIKTEVDRIGNAVGNMSQSVISAVLNDGNNVPTSQPTADTTWIPAIKYTDSTEEINWQIKQYGVDEWEKIFATSDETVNNSDTLTDDSTLQFSMDANRLYHIRGTIIYETDGVADFKCKWTGPASPTEVTTVIVDGLGNHTIFNSYDTLTNDVSSSERYAITFSAVVKNGANAGTFKFQFAQNTANVSDTKRKAGSVIEYMSQPIAGATTVAMDYLTYAHTLYDVAVRQALTRTMDVNTYALTLQDINIAYGRTVVMDNNSYALTLQDVTIRKDLVLDTWTGAAGAWAFTKLRTAYSGNCIKIRRASDSATQDIGFSGNDLDTAAIGTFCSGTTGYIHTIYDQSGNGNNLVMTTAASQPLIYSGGAVRTLGGLPSCQFDGSDDYMALTSSIGANGPWTSCMVTKRAASAGLGLALSGTSSQYTAWRYSDNTLYIRGDSGFAASTSTYTTAAQEHLMAVYTSSAASVWSNGSSIAMGSLSLPVAGSFVDLGRRSGSSEYHAADFQLLILWKSDLSAVQSSIDTRIRNYFGL